MVGQRTSALAAMPIISDSILYVVNGPLVDQKATRSVLPATSGKRFAAVVASSIRQRPFWPISSWTLQDDERRLHLG